MPFLWARTIYIPISSKLVQEHFAIYKISEFKIKLENRMSMKQVGETCFVVGKAQTIGLPTDIKEYCTYDQVDLKM